MDFLYNTGINVFKWAVQLASFKKPKAKLMLEGQARTFDYLQEHLEHNGKYIWVHAASLGEFEQGRPLIELIKRNHPQERILLTFFSPSGYEVRKNYDKADAVCYLPFDTVGNVKRFLDLVDPKMAIFVKYEFWGNYLNGLKKRHIPTYIISAIFREGQPFFCSWGKMFREMLRCFTRIYVQNEESRQLLKRIHVDNAEVAGDTRFDRVADVRATAKEFPLIETMVKGHRLTMVMGSSWQPDEDIVIPYFNAHPEMKLIIAPHEFNAERLKIIMSKCKRKTALYSQLNTDNAQDVDCLIVDCFGILASLYRYGQMAYVGGGFGAGIHNVNEAAVYGIPVIFGPKFQKFAEAKDLIAVGGGFSIDNAEDFQMLMDEMLHNNKVLQSRGNIAGNYIKSHLGATEFIYKEIKGKL